MELLVRVAIDVSGRRPSWSMRPFALCLIALACGRFNYELLDDTGDGPGGAGLGGSGAAAPNGGGGSANNGGGSSGTTGGGSSGTTGSAGNGASAQGGTPSSA